MPDKKNCPTCKGDGFISVLVNEHDDKKETIKCPTCNGSTVIHQMTEQEERDYWNEYW